MTEPLHIHVYRSLQELDALRPQWDALLEHIPGATIFSTWEWLGPWWRSFQGSRRLLVLGFSEPGGELIGLAPLSLDSRRIAPAVKFSVLHFMGDGSGDSDNLEVLAKPGHDERVARALFDFLRQHKDLWDLCELNRMPAESPVGLSLQRSAEELGWPRTTCYRHHMVLSLPDSWDELVNRLPKEERRKLRRQRRHVEEGYKVCSYRVQNEDELGSHLEVLYRLHQKRWEKRTQLGSFAEASRRNFYADLGHMLLQHGWLEFWILKLDEKSVAAQFCFRYRQTVFALQGGFDVDYAAASVGYVLRSYVLQNLIERGVRRFDSLEGTGYHKSRWGADEHKYLDLRLARPFTQAGAYLRLATSASVSKEWLRAHLPVWMWSSLHWLNTMVRPGARGK